MKASRILVLVVALAAGGAAAFLAGNIGEKKPEFARAPLVHFPAADMPTATGDLGMGTAMSGPNSHRPTATAGGGQTETSTGEIRNADINTIRFGVSSKI